MKRENPSPLFPKASEFQQHPDPVSAPQDYRLDHTGCALTLIRKGRATTNPSRHFHPWWELFYIVEGERTFFYANRTIHIKAGNFLCIPPGVLHRSVNPIDEVCSLYNIYFADFEKPVSHEDGRMQLILPLLEQLEPCRMLSPSNQALVSSLFERIGLELLNPGPTSMPLVWSLVMQMLVCVLRDENGSENAHAPEHIKGFIAPVIDYLNNHFRENLTLESVASRFKVTPSHLSRTFKKETRFGFVEYINSQRIAECCRLLRTTNLPVLEIALSCGFGSLPQFGRCFRELTGSSPREYRRRN